MTLPVVADLPRLLRHLAREEDAERRELARLEARLRRYEDVERPAYDAWLRLELGPVVTEIEELAAALRARQMLAERVNDLVEDEGLHPREALYVLQEAPDVGAAGAAGRAEREARHRDEIEARRRAKLDRKRAERKRKKHAQRQGGAIRGDDGTETSRRRLLAIYRALARSLHPDSPSVVRTLAPARLRAIWAEVQAAYALRSLERLLALATWLETIGAGGGEDDGRDGPFLSLAERRERVRTLRRSARALDRRLAALVSEPAWEFAATAPPLRRKLRTMAARRLAAERDAMRSALAAVDEFLAGIGPPRPPRTQRAGRRR